MEDESSSAQIPSAESLTVLSEMMEVNTSISIDDELAMPVDEWIERMLS